MKSGFISNTSCQKLFLLTALLWSGMLIGVSGISTPIKFQAESLSLPVALDVGRVTFHFFSRIEWGLVAVLFVCALGGARQRSLLYAAIGLLGIMLVEVAWLLPALDKRAVAIMSGATVSPSLHHIFYVVAEGSKLFLLVIVSIGILWKRDTFLVIEE